MYDEIFNNLEKQLPISEINELRNKTIHLGIFSEPYLTYMLEGKKTIESRFSKNKIIPYNQITKDDIVIVKNPVVMCWDTLQLKMYYFLT